ncbi:serine/arginine repetitive matrix protein 1-like [Schistocerca gregaria]|uniref:serine/arginine repetitive matrix protein 1-like n=1 Tax=Schistocerca gregaria TaxID=7010 RepID=UPI00211E9CAC|nr:serine/arginine repetitive matrix protein 1-like [Schistocerca gregaria]
MSIALNISSGLRVKTDPCGSVWELLADGGARPAPTWPRCGLYDEARRGALHTAAPPPPPSAIPSSQVSALPAAPSTLSSAGRGGRHDSCGSETRHARWFQKPARRPRSVCARPRTAHRAPCHSARRRRTRKRRRASPPSRVRPPPVARPLGTRKAFVTSPRLPHVQPQCSRRRRNPPPWLGGARSHAPASRASHYRFGPSVEYSPGRNLASAATPSLYSPSPQAGRDAETTALQFCRVFVIFV